MAIAEPDWSFLKAYLANSFVRDYVRSPDDAEKVFRKLVVTVKACACKGPHNLVYRGGDDDALLEHFIGVGSKDGRMVRRLRTESSDTFKELLGRCK